MQIIINHELRPISRVRYVFAEGVFTVKWPLDTDLNENDREFKVNSAIKRCIAHDTIGRFSRENAVLKGNRSLKQIDEFAEVDLYWEQS